MRRALVTAAALAAFGLAAPAMAQSADSAEDDLDCALFTALEAGKTNDAETRNGILYSMLYFIGRWEGATGRKIEVVMTERALTDAAARSDTLAGKCAARMMDFGDRLDKLGSRLEKAGR
ncbi:hypothetical protein [Novosphingobium sp.]|uniref:hypothetical protein n=1 Tax=Novosphingobium sp. TaxID=1874826 RepID=UPI001ECE6197|nr:hypothetical protein [Novosphingobium sp.]MBK6800841.1 hypothetical protein [Novosphingobium sp.]MBK9011399.1 hypothetical protein [Novosphingobium sp.]